jgi:hypothetical protein
METHFSKEAFERVLSSLGLVTWNQIPFTSRLRNSKDGFKEEMRKGVVGYLSMPCFPYI